MAQAAVSGTTISRFPTTSAGVERLSSKATIVHDDLAQAMKDETLGYAVFASYNYSPAFIAPLYCICFT